MMEERRYTAWIKDDAPESGETSIEFDDLTQEELLFLIKISTENGHFILVG